jgi:predicted Zn-dependent protease with MMP-like domain
MTMGVHQGPLGHDTVESLYLGLANTELTTEDDVIYRGNREVFLKLDGNNITLGANVYFNFDNFCADASGALTGSGCVSVCVCNPERFVRNSHLIELRNVDDRTAPSFAGEENPYVEDDIVQRLYRIVEESTGVPANFDNITFEQLVEAGIKFNYESRFIRESFVSDFVGKVYDFFPGMVIETQVKVIPTDKTPDGNIPSDAINFRIYNREGRAYSRIEMYTLNNLRHNKSIMTFAAVTAHEVGHRFGLSDAYGETWPLSINEGYQLTGRESEVRFNSNNTNFPNAGLMYGNGSANLNDIEMILLAFVGDKLQEHIPGVAINPQSIAIKSALTYSHVRGPTQTLEWRDGSFIYENERSFRDANWVTWGYVVKDSEITIVRVSGITYGRAVIPTEFPEFPGIPVTRIGDFAFTDSEFHTVEIHSQIKNIGDRAFSGLVGLRTVIFEEDSLLESIGGNAFWGSGITLIRLPTNVTRIGGGAFSFCQNLKSVIFNAEPPSWIAQGNALFVQSNNLKAIYVPNGLGNEFREYLLDLNELVVEVSFDENGNPFRFDDYGNLVSFCTTCLLLMDVCDCCGECGTHFSCDCSTHCQKCRRELGRCRCCGYCEEYLLCECPICFRCGSHVEICECFCRGGCGQRIRNCVCAYCDTCGRFNCYSIQNGIFCIGDVNGSGGIDVDDALQILRLLINLSNIIGWWECNSGCEELSDCCNLHVSNYRALEAALITGSFNPSQDDAIAILRWLVGLPSALCEKWGIKRL